MNKPQNIIRNEFGYYQLKNIPSKKELSDYYFNKYYQKDFGNYSKTYSPDELKYFSNKLDEKFFILKSYLEMPISSWRILDVGCGEGFTLDYFNKKNIDIKGIDYSSIGIKNHNPHCIPFFIEGDIDSEIDNLLSSSQRFNVIWLDNVLEHVVNPLELLKKCNKLAHKESILVIEVPNDFSDLQTMAYENEIISEPFWIVEPDHISYFSKESLNTLCNVASWENKITIADFPIDFNLFNKEANYINDKQKGKGAHLQRVLIDNLIHKNEISKVIDFYKSLANIGMGRQIISFYKNNKNEI